MHPASPLGRSLGLALAVGAGLAAAAPASAQIVDVGNLKIVATGLGQPLYAVCPPGEPNRMMIVNRTGTIRVLDLSTTPPTLIATPFLNISSRIQTVNSEQGLLGLAFDPNYATNRRFYIDYVEPRGDLQQTGNNPPSFTDRGRTVVARFTTSANPNVANTTEERLLTLDQPFVNHNGGCLQIGPDGYLYIATGDGGSGNDPDGRAQKLSSDGAGPTDNAGSARFGKLLRIDVSPATGYAVPPTNPFVGRAGDDEIAMYGLRNPWRFSFDRLTGDLLIADVGQDVREEVDFIAAGQLLPGGNARNMGWRCWEGDRCNSGGGRPECGASCSTAGVTFPIHTYDHNGTGGFSITGGYVYRGQAIRQWKGRYFFADYVSNRVWSLRVVAGAATDVQLMNTALTSAGSDVTSLTNIGVASFAQDAAGELYVCTFGSGGRVIKIVPQFKRADWNIDGEVNGNDISDYINSWYADILGGTTDGDYNGDGETNGNDISDYINDWYLNLG